MVALKSFKVVKLVEGSAAASRSGQTGEGGGSGERRPSHPHSSDSESESTVWKPGVSTLGLTGLWFRFEFTSAEVVWCLVIGSSVAFGVMSLLWRYLLLGPNLAWEQKAELGFEV